MGQKNAKGSVSIYNASGRIRLRWRCQKKRYSLNLFLFNKANLLQAKKIALQIEHDLLADSFYFIGDVLSYCSLLATTLTATPIRVSSSDTFCSSSTTVAFFCSITGTGVLLLCITASC